MLHDSSVHRSQKEFSAKLTRANEEGREDGRGGYHLIRASLLYHSSITHGKVPKNGFLAVTLNEVRPIRSYFVRDLLGNQKLEL